MFLTSRYSELPEDPDQLRCLARYTGLSHILTLSPSDINSNIPSVDLHHVDIPLDDRSRLVLALPAACNYIQNALSTPHGRILVHSETESIAALAICAFRTSPKHITSSSGSSLSWHLSDTVTQLISTRSSADGG